MTANKSYKLNTTKITNNNEKRDYSKDVDDGTKNFQKVL